MKDSDEQYTPKWIFDALNVKFDLDVCAPEGGVDWIPANKHYSLKDNSLNQSWNGMVWMNPPFSEAKVWCNKFIMHKNGIALVQMSKSYWFKQLWDHADVSILILLPSMKFIKPDGKPNSVYMPVCLIAMGLHARTALAQSGLGRIR